MSNLKEIINVLGKPYFETENVALYKGDCVEYLKKLPRQSIDSVITSPPYNIGKSYEQNKSVEEYVKWSDSWLESIPDVLTETGSFLFNLGFFPIPNIGKNVPIAYLLWNHVNMFLLQEIVWNYGAGVACKKMLSPRNEKWLWFVKDQMNYTFNLDLIRDPDVKYPNQKKNGKLRCNTLGKNPSDVWQIAKVTSGKNRSSEERTSHPAQFPTDLIDRFMLGMTNPGDVVLDPFMGSGSTAISALKNGRKSIGFEILEEYCELSKNRIINYLEGR